MVQPNSPLILIFRLQYGFSPFSLKTTSDLAKKIIYIFQLSMIQTLLFMGS